MEKWRFSLKITSEKSIKDACESHPLCIISILPHIMDCQSECRNNYLTILRQLGDKFKKHQWGYGTILEWNCKKLSFGTFQLGLGRGRRPARSGREFGHWRVRISGHGRLERAQDEVLDFARLVQCGRYQRVSAVGGVSLFKFIIHLNHAGFVMYSELAYGRGSTFPVKNSALPAIKTMPAWDGKDAEVGGLLYIMSVYCSLQIHFYSCLKRKKSTSAMWTWRKRSSDFFGIKLIRDYCSLLLAYCY